MKRQYEHEINLSNLIESYVLSSYKLTIKALTSLAKIYMHLYTRIMYTLKN